MTHGIVRLLIFCTVAQALKSGEAVGPFCNTSRNCQKTQTCCTSYHDNSPGCCAHPNANCCGLRGDTCCQQGFLCDPVAGGCARYVNSSLCQGCQETVRYISQYGCGGVCAYMPPPANAACLLIVKFGLCDTILNWLTSTGSPTLTICSLSGFCSAGTCACSYCTRFTYGRCLSVPNHCPSSKPQPAPEPEPFPQPEPQPDPQPESQPEPFPLLTSDTKLCYNGVCNAASEGCCLTCF